MRPELTLAQSLTLDIIEYKMGEVSWKGPFLTYTTNGALITLQEDIQI